VVPEFVVEVKSASDTLITQKDKMVPAKLNGGGVLPGFAGEIRI